MDPILRTKRHCADQPNMFLLFPSKLQSRWSAGPTFWLFKINIAKMQPGLGGGVGKEGTFLNSCLRLEVEVAKVGLLKVLKVFKLSLSILIIITKKTNKQPPRFSYSGVGVSK
uniref:Uncharacterized protein n=1 Tax=Micrurus corallinus TaxID=54390 RepID=A0A2D4EX55_MICCO